MLSRVAENLYWMSRYVERAENVARLLDVGFHLELDAASVTRVAGELGPTESVLTILACREAFELAHPGRSGSVEAQRDAVLQFLTFDRNHQHSILEMLAAARENARATQETLSGEAWSQVNRLYLYMVSRRARRRFATSPSRFFEGVKHACVLVTGLFDGTLPRNEVYHFLQIGRYLERVNQVSRILNVKMHGLRDGGPVADPPMRVVHWSSLLRSCSAYESYLRENQDRIDPEGVVRYLVLDPHFPRALRFCVARCVESLREIAGHDEDDEFSSEVERQLGRLDSRLKYVDVDEIFSQGLSPFLVDVQEACFRVGEELHQAYFHT
ncbi:MAG: alpha-E domain-containing protein [Isosphaeraceae bacterium]